VRRVVGAVIALSGVGLVWRAVSSVGAISHRRALTLLDEHANVGVAGDPHIATHAVWPVLTVACGVLALVSGALIAWRGHRWQAMSTKYETPPAQESDPGKTAATLWTKLDRGEDPTD
jgi:uncharacterized membrane protein (TIGR02234 family)